MFDTSNVKLHTLPDAPTVSTATREQFLEHLRRLQDLNADVIPRRFCTHPDDKDGFFERACHHMLEEEDCWRQCNVVWAWIDEKPVWESPVDWDIRILPDPERPTRRRFRFSLLGGGQLTVAERFKRHDRSIDVDEVYCSQTQLRITADIGNGLQRFAGMIRSAGYEMKAEAVVPSGHAAACS
jgi:hypothetical protein